MSKLLWIPADLPLFADKAELLNSYQVDYVNEKKARAFNSQQLTKHTDNYGISVYKDKYVESHKCLFDYITDHMPYTDLVSVKIHNQARQGKTHLDFTVPGNNMDLYNHNHELEPCGYRMVIAGTRQGHLYIEQRDGTRIFPTLPESTDWYILGHTNAPHGLEGVDADRYILFCHAWINEEQHNQILKRSIEKYSEYAVYDLD